MKKIILFLALFTATCFTAKATHLMGGEIVVGVDSTNKAYIVMTLYRDITPSTATLSATQTLDLSLISNPSASGISVQLSRVNIDTLPSFYPVERHIYTGTVQLAQNGKFRLQWSLCCRNHAIDNSTNPGSESMTLYTEFTSYTSTNSASPVFLNAPVVSFPLDTLWNYNPLPFDVDGDSLHWSIDTPVSTFPNYIVGYTTPPGNANGPLTMDSQTGQITWSPSQVGNYVISILVEEFRSGVQIGEIRRDMQFIVIPDTVNMQLVLPNSLTVNNNGVGSTNLQGGNSSQLTFELTSSYSLAQLNMEATGDPFEIPGSDADFQVQTTTGPNIKGNFSWTPTINDVRPLPYRLTIRAIDKKFAYDFTVLLNVKKSTVGIDENGLSIEGLSLYPNPNDGRVNLVLSQVANDKVTIEILNLKGQRVKEVTMDKTSLENGAELNIDAAPGTYILRLKGEEYQSKVFVIQ
ncbi:T9SS type A sorting domain-containing protein [Owenweeksia hongkongensis]|uniref:Secretion system C-terminal sorting domain-containing protein n=1 Tax=Owenweeksia hongkongensis (strain DSM 17368 / CIP 108786 / JCM 12287 / NRRL B-23963 / UST20020801) TaxID=926562 RepID=G8R0A7_OWEHD|nr:T9SS type A sorting domain-containing protein [Owenweeksia hongkongensis]AEV31567.1 hypothetical protein Oweho_0551 [Owenweeksia hongkongensis DSM 17368]